ncbi:hypothetical protein ACFWBF_31850 [Streptomyces sp. NPDC060028]|uniref:hypothetical protein n=1 Tax=Streptomyces sp. NPDC060028 TaxID=3347041 RepID=UPI00369665F9
MTDQNTTAAPSASEPDAPRARKDRRKLYAALRWTAAFIAFAATGTAVTYGVAHAERTDIPVLSTRSDGRWTYPKLVKPNLPPGAPLPESASNSDHTHYAKLSQLLLPMPTGAEPDKEFRADTDGVVTADAFLEEYAPDARPKLKEGFDHEGLRQIIGRGWSMPDGTRTRIYLLRFHSSGFVDTFRGCGVNVQLKGVPVIEQDLSWSKAKASQPGSLGAGGFQGSGTLSESRASVYQEVQPAGDEQVKLGCLQSGDIQAVILQTRTGEVATIPFHQTVILQNQLLG